MLALFARRSRSVKTNPLNNNGSGMNKFQAILSGLDPDSTNGGDGDGDVMGRGKNHGVLKTVAASNSNNAMGAKKTGAYDPMADLGYKKGGGSRGSRTSVIGDSIHSVQADGEGVLAGANDELFAGAGQRFGGVGATSKIVDNSENLFCKDIGSKLKDCDFEGEVSERSERAFRKTSIRDESREMATDIM